MSAFDKLKEQIELLFVQLNPNLNYQSYQLISTILEYADDIIDDDNNGWISVDDELPDEDELVLLLFNSGNQTMGKLIKKDKAHQVHDYSLRNIDDEFVFWLITTDNDSYYGVYHDIGLTSDFSHWQPRPQPPKE